MNKFTISRLNTELGTFRISGTCSNENLTVAKVEIKLIEMMGTDGWVLLNQSSGKVIDLIKEIMPILQTHLQIKYL